MGALLVCWLLFPLLLLLVTVGLGLLLERAAGLKLPLPFHVPLGFAVLVVVAQLTTLTGWTAPLTPYFVVALALAGLWLGRVRLLKPGMGQLGVFLLSLGVFAIYAAPVVLSGSATFAGYAINGDISVHFSSIAYLMEHGRSFASDLPLSSYTLVVKGYIDGSGYPSGGQLALGALWPLTGQDLPWVYQPFMAFLGFALFWSLYALCGLFLRSRLYCAAVCFFASTSTLVVGFAFQGSIKELTALVLIPLLFALLRYVGWSARQVVGLLPLAVAVSALLATLGVVALAWAGPVVLAALAVLLGRREPESGARSFIAAVGGFALFALVLSLPTVIELGKYLNVSQAVLTSQVEKGTLLSPLRKVQMFGIWPVGDLRFEPSAYLTRTYGVIGTAVVFAFLGFGYLVRKRQLILTLFSLTSFLAWAVLTVKGSPWADAKVLMIVSPAAVLLVGIGLVSLAKSGRRVEAGLAAAAIGGSILISNAFIYHEAMLAPKERLQELDRVGSITKNSGSTLYTEFEEFGKYFLRDSLPEGLSDSWRAKQTLLRGGYPVRYGYSHDLDEIPVRFILRFNNIVMRRSPVRTRPPAGYRLTFRGRYYELWRRNDRTSKVLAHLPLGEPIKVQRGAVPTCRSVEQLARQASGRGGRLAYVETVPSTVLIPAAANDKPASWGPFPWLGNEDNNLATETIGAGVWEGKIAIDRPGRYLLWAAGSFGRPIKVYLDGRPVGRLAYKLSGKGQYLRVVTATLGSGEHTVKLVRGSGKDPYPGSGGRNRILGPLVATKLSEPYEDKVRYLPGSEYRQLCSKQLDWVEVVAGT